MTGRLSFGSERIIRVHVARSGRLVAPWEYHITDGAGIVGELRRRRGR